MAETDTDFLRYDVNEYGTPVSVHRELIVRTQRAHDAESVAPANGAFIARSEE